MLRFPALPVGTHGPCVRRVHWVFLRNIHLLEEVRAFSGEFPIAGERTSRASLPVNHSSLLFLLFINRFYGTEFYSWYLRYVETKYPARYLWNLFNHVDYISSSVSRGSTRIYFINWLHGLHCFLLVILAIRGGKTPRKVSVKSFRFANEKNKRLSAYLCKKVNQRREVNYCEF